MSFSQRKLWEALRAPQSIESTDEMEAMVEKYPYFQLLRTLVAKAKHDRQSPDAYDWLGKAAIYAPDRRRLRQVFYDELVVTLPEADTFQNQEVDHQVSLLKESDAADDDILVETPDVAAEEVQDTDTTEVEHVDSDSTDNALESEKETIDSTDTESEEEPIREENDVAEAKDIAQEDETLREELEKTLHALQQSKEQLPDSTTSDASSQSTTDAASAEETSASEGAHSAEKPSTPQQAIIERFMRANPSISRDMDSEDAKPAADLAASSTELQDDLVTENLAEIMLKQGKEAKAIALYEKLMLKYPEKKTYFAQKIDQLKDN